VAEDLLARVLRTFEKHQQELEGTSMGHFVVIRGEDIVGTYADFDEAAKAALQRFGAGETYMIRKVGKYSATLSQAALLGRTGANPFDRTTK
jgi:hypothetical protein